MRLGKKTFLFSLAIAFLVGILMLGYMIFMLPSLYMDQRLSKNFNLVKNSHRNFITNKDASYEKDRELDNSIGIIVPKKGYEVQLKSLNFSGSLQIKTKNLQDILDETRFIIERMNNSDNDNKTDDNKALDDVFVRLAEELSKTYTPVLRELQEKINLDLEIYSDNIGFEPTRTKFNKIFDKSFLTEYTAVNKLSKTEYTTYIAMSTLEDQYMITFASTATPNPDEIRPVMINSIYTIVPVIVLISLGISAIFTRLLVKPIEALSKDADERASSDYDIDQIKVEGSDEISDLAVSLNQLYKKQRESVKKLEDDAKRKEVFMKSFSHQLKTPLASSSLLVDSMIHKVGKYSDTQVYLPELKIKLQEMQRILARIFDIEKMVKNKSLSKLSINDVIEEILSNKKLKIEEKELKVKINGSLVWNTDSEIIYQILDNLINNAISYTDKSGFIDISIDDDKLIITNKPTAISESLKPVIFEPFVTGSPQGGGHGLGLYVVKYFAESIDLRIDFITKEDQVSFTLEKGD